LSTTKKLFNFLLSRSTPYAEEILGVVSVDFEATGQPLITYSLFVKYLRKNGNTTKHCVSSL